MSSSGTPGDPSSDFQARFRQEFILVNTGAGMTAGKRLFGGGINIMRNSVCFFGLVAYTLYVSVRFHKEVK